MTNKQFAEMARGIALNIKTLYVLGAFGAPLNDTNKERYSNNYPYNKKHEDMIRNAGKNVFAFDCSGLVKGILWGWNADLKNMSGGAQYQSNDVPDINANTIFSKCSDISDDFNCIDIGEVCWMDGHIGIYIGGGLTVESNPNWKNGVQITACNRQHSCYNTQIWAKHGKLPWVTYTENVTKERLLEEIRERLDLLEEII